MLRLKGKLNDKLLGCVRKIAIGLVVAIALPSLAHAQLVCTSGSVPGSGDCTETVSAGPAAVQTPATLTLNQWVSNAAPGYNETLVDVQFTYGVTLSGSSMSITNNATNPGDTTFQVVVYAATPITLGTGAPSNLPLPVSAGGSAFVNFTLGLGDTTFLPTSDFPIPIQTFEVTTDLGGYSGLGTYQLDTTIPESGLGLGLGYSAAAVLSVEGDWGAAP